MSAPEAPFARLNLRWNPFGEPKREDRAHLAVVDRVDLERWVAAFLGHRRAVQWIGESGRGKSTHLLALSQHVPEAGYHRVAEDGRGPLPTSPRVILDEAQFLPRRSRRRLFSRVRTIAVGTHEDLEAELSRAGLEVETVRLAGISVDKVAEVAVRRIEWARRDAGPIPRIRRETAEALIDRCGDDLRAIEDLLYERFQRLEGPADVEV